MLSALMCAVVYIQLERMHIVFRTGRYRMRTHFVWLFVFKTVGARSTCLHKTARWVGATLNDRHFIWLVLLHQKTRAYCCTNAHAGWLHDERALNAGRGVYVAYPCKYIAAVEMPDSLRQ